jgi:HEPN domain-containing protein
MKNNYLEWIKRAESNINIAKLRKLDGIVMEDLCHNAHQAVEKSLKGLLVFFGADYPKTHRLKTLAQKLDHFIKVPQWLRDNFGLLNFFAIEAK